MEESKQQEIINLRQIIKSLFAQRRRFYLPLGLTFVLASIYIFSKPRFYETDAKLAPEVESSMGGGALSSIASSFGFDLGNMQSTDAINPLLYPDLMEDNAFVSKLFNIVVTTNDGELRTSYYNYLDKHQKKPWWNGGLKWVKGLFKKNEPEDADNAGEFSPYKLSKRQSQIVESIRSNIALNVDKKTGVISINVKDQDPLICKTMTDSVIVHLQAFITNYRTSKARGDVAYYTALVDSARIEYLAACQQYSRAADANMNAVLESYRTRISNLENEMQLKYNAYSMMVTQLQAAKTKVQERTPAFTLLKGAEVPVRPAGPKRMAFVFIMMLLATIATSFYIQLHSNSTEHPK